MAATKYQILYRYTNPNSNQFIKNDTDSEYKQVFELYHDKHKISIGGPEEKLAANNEKSQLIIDGNNTSNDNYGMLFKFTGTKRKNKKVWTQESTGYVIRDKEAVRNKITRAVDGDFSGDYLLIEGTTIENGVVIAKKNISTITIATDSLGATNRKYYEVSELEEKIKLSTIYKLKESSYLSYSSEQPITYLDRFNLGGGAYQNANPVYTGPVFVGEEPKARSGNVNSSSSCVIGNNASFKTVQIFSSQVKTYEIPAHYEEVAEYPYVICDTYERVEQSPWFILSTHASLPSALEKVRMIVKAVGIENVKMIKVVPTDQFVKIK